MGPLQIEKATEVSGNPGAWVALEPGAEPVFVAQHHWIGVDLDGTLARDDEEGHFLPPLSAWGADSWNARDGEKPPGGRRDG